MNKYQRRESKIIKNHDKWFCEVGPNGRIIPSYRYARREYRWPMRWQKAVVKVLAKRRLRRKQKKEDSEHE